MELTAHSSYYELDYEINFWRTKSGLEVDFMLGDGDAAIEVKGSNRVDNRELRSLKAFIEEFSPRLALVVCNEQEERVVDQIRIMPWRHFLNELWEGRIIK
jgi:predicted AAA+ superfamily ATPase